MCDSMCWPIGLPIIPINVFEVDDVKDRDV